MPLTAVQIKSAPVPASGRTVLSDGRGLELRITPNGVRTFSFVGSLFGKKRRWTLGRFPDLSLRQAREIRDDYAARLVKGIDPERGHSGRDVIRLEAAFENFLKRYARPKNRSAPETERMLRHDLLPRFGNYPVTKVRRPDIQSMLAEIVDRGAPVLAGRVLANTRKFFNWCIEQEYCEMNPCDRISQPVSARKSRRDRVLTDDEIGRIWGASFSLPVHGRAFIQLLILTGQRRGEVAQIQRRQIEGDLWTIPGDIAKNGKPNLVPLNALSEIVIEWIQRYWRKEEPDDLYLLSGTNGLRPFSGFSKLKKEIDEVSKVKDWRWHDLRRTLATRVSEKGVPPHVVRALLNHTDQSVTAIYNRYEYLEEKKEALKLWARHVGASGRKHMPDEPGAPLYENTDVRDVIERFHAMLREGVTTDPTRPEDDRQPD